jgi:hypothetical protein
MRSLNPHIGTPSGPGLADASREVKRRTYVGVVIDHRRNDCANEMKNTLKRKNKGGEIFSRKISQR